MMMSTDQSNQSPLDASALTERPQRLGVLPTMRFWNRRRNWRHVATPVTVATLAAFVFVLALDPPAWAAALIGALVPYLAAGIMERRLRRRHRDRATEIP